MKTTEVQKTIYNNNMLIESKTKVTDIGMLSYSVFPGENKVVGHEKLYYKEKDHFLFLEPDEICEALRIMESDTINFAIINTKSSNNYIRRLANWRINNPRVKIVNVE